MGALVCPVCGPARDKARAEAGRGRWFHPCADHRPDPPVNDAAEEVNK